MRVAISNVIQASLESAFQLVLQLYILGTQYNDLKQVELKFSFVFYFNSPSFVIYWVNVVSASFW